MSTLTKALGERIQSSRNSRQDLWWDEYDLPPDVWDSDVIFPRVLLEYAKVAKLLDCPREEERLGENLVRVARTLLKVQTALSARVPSASRAFTIKWGKRCEKQGDIYPT